MGCSRLLSISAWRSLLQAVSMPATWTPASSDVQAHGVLRALCSLTTEHAPLQSRIAASCEPPAESARHGAHGCGQIAYDAKDARPNATSACVWTNAASSRLATATLHRHSQGERTAAVPLSQRRPLSSGAATDRDTPATDQNSAIEVTAASTSASVMSLLEPLLALFAAILQTACCMCSDLTCSNPGKL